MLFKKWLGIAISYIKFKHIQTQTQISQIKDEIVSVKKHVTVMTADTNQTVDNIAEHTHFIPTEIVKQADIMQTRLVMYLTH